MAPLLHRRKFASAMRSSANGATTTSCTPSHSPSLVPPRIGPLASRSKGDARPDLVQRKNRKRLRGHGDSQFASRQLRLCLSEEKSGRSRSLRRRVAQRNVKLPRLIGVVERHDQTFFLCFARKNIR